MKNCLICGKEVSRNLAAHIKNQHNMCAQDYYDARLKKEGEGVCIICGKPTKFTRFNEGYSKYCSRACSSKDKMPKSSICNLKKDSIDMNSKAANKAKGEFREYIEFIYKGEVIKDPILYVDYYFPKKKLYITFHKISETIGNDKNYYLWLSKNINEKGCRLIQIFETEWIEKTDKIKQLLNIALGYTSRIYARNCDVREITNETARPFNNATHIQGHRNAKITYGLFYNNELVQLMSFSHTKYNRNLKSEDEYEIIRGCPGSNNIVVGGVSKLFKYFIRNYNPSKIFSYCDFNYFDGKSYEACGMKFDGYTGPNKWWIIDNKLVPRSPTRYKEYKELASGTVWGAGSKKYIWERDENK